MYSSILKKNCVGWKFKMSRPQIRWALNVRQKMARDGSRCKTGPRLWCWWDLVVRWRRRVWPVLSQLYSACWHCHGNGLLFSHQVYEIPKAAHAHTLLYFKASCVHVYVRARVRVRVRVCTCLCVCVCVCAADMPLALTVQMVNSFRKRQCPPPPLKWTRVPLI